MNFDVLTIGTATRDTFIKSGFLKTLKDKKHLQSIGFKTGEARCIASGSKIEINRPEFLIGGGAVNSAITFSRMGFKAASLLSLGKDPAGDEILKELKKEGVKNIVSGQKENETAQSFVLLGADGERTILVFRGSSGNFNVNQKDLSGVSAKWVYIAPGNMPFSLISRLVGYFHKKGSFVAINPSKDFLKMGMKKIKPILNKSKLVILNREEASYLTGVDYNQKDKIFKKLDDEILGIALMTDGNKGATVSDGCKVFECGTFREKEVIDRTGAGDAFGSGFLSGLIMGKETCKKGICQPSKIFLALKIASANATSVIEKIGATPGIITGRDFKNNSRWKNLRVKVRKIRC